MAKQVGTFKIEGTIGDLTFYKSQGEHLVRQKGGVSGDRIKNDPNFARTRENNEFGQASTVGKGIRDGMRNLIDKEADSRVTSRLVQQLFAVIKGDAVNQRGQQTVTSGNVGLLTGFEFNIRGKLLGILFAPMAYLDPTDKAIIQLVLIELLQEVNGTFYSLRNGSFNALRVIGVDV